MEGQEYKADQFERTVMLLGKEAKSRLAAAKVAVFGLGGVGGSCAEALARSGIGYIDLYDNDVVSLTNLNRQVVALHSTIGRLKVDVMAERLLDINPEIRTGSYNLFYLPETADEVDLGGYDYVADAIDNITGKIELIVRAKEAGVRIISSMGAANKLDPTCIAVTDVFKTENDPLAKVIRRELRTRGIAGLKVVWSKETPVAASPSRRPPASCAFVPPVFGLILAGEVVKDIASS